MAHYAAEKGQFDIFKYLFDEKRVLDKPTTRDRNNLWNVDAIAEDYAIVKERLAPDAPIVSDKFFESAIVKLQQGRTEL